MKQGGIAAALCLSLMSAGVLRAQLSGVVDIHVHSDPDSVARSIDAFDLAKLAREQGMRALVLKNHYEPTASLDPDVALRVRANILQQCQQEGTALLVTSHNMTEIERLAQRVVFLAAGRVQVDGPVDGIAAQLGSSTLEEVYLHLRESDQKATSARSGEPR